MSQIGAFAYLAHRYFAISDSQSNAGAEMAFSKIYFH